MAINKPERGPQDRRRSQRVFLSVGVTVEGKTTKGENFREDTMTLAVNAHGGLVTLSKALDPAREVVLTHRATGDQMKCKVAFNGTIQKGKTEVGLEFTTPSPKFWHIDFPPTDWSPPEE
jgi:hypothetical protein